jgi:poly(hydroxyalkanoate) granule-associated protein
MSDDNSPKINVTRGKKKRSNKKKSSRKKSAGSELPGAMEVASGLARRARNMWLAGLGALSVAEEASSQVFNALVEEGKSWEQERRKKTERTAQQVRSITEEGTQAVEAVEQRVRDEVNDALKQIGVPHRDDVQELRDQVDALSEKMDALADAVAEKRNRDDA